MGNDDPGGRRHQLHYHHHHHDYNDDPGGRKHHNYINHCIAVNCTTLTSTDARSTANKITNAYGTTCAVTGAKENPRSNLHADANPGEFNIRSQRKYENGP